MIERDGYKFELNTVRGVHCSVHGCSHDYSAVIVTWPTGDKLHYCRRCYAYNRPPVSVYGQKPTERHWPRFDEILSEVH
jgi:hypothetical protein